MVSRFFILLVFLLLGCAELERNNPYDVDAVNYIGKNGGSSSIASSSSALPSSSSIMPSSSSIAIIKETFTDSRDGQTYEWITIGTQKWMAENVNYNAEGSLCYDNDTANCDKYGRLYDWAAARTACPSGWHLPSETELAKLIDYAGGESTAGKKLKAASGWLWGGSGTDNYGFAALPGGCSTQYGGNFLGAGSEGLWWSSTQKDADFAHYLYMVDVSANVIISGFSNLKYNFYSVRCIKG